MVRVIEYKDGFVYFRCDRCDFWGGMDIASSLGQNCVLDVDVVCEVCGEGTVLYVLKCADQAYAKELNAKLLSLKARRASEVS